MLKVLIKFYADAKINDLVTKYKSIQVASSSYLHINLSRYLTKSYNTVYFSLPTVYLI